MRFYVIYSADWPSHDYNGHPNAEHHYAPPREQDGLWQLTEAGESEYAYLGEDFAGSWEEIGSVTDFNRYRWTHSEHRKWVAELSRDDFEAFIDHCLLEATEDETMGSLTFEYGWLPALSFKGDEDSIVDAYVTPLLDRLSNPDREDERDWERVAETVRRHYRDGVPRRGLV